MILIGDVNELSEGEGDDIDGDVNELSEGEGDVNELGEEK